MGILQTIFKNNKIINSIQRWKELGTYRAYFNSFGGDLYKSYVVRSCIRPLAEHTSKANVKCDDKNIENLLSTNPNMYMNGKAFLYKVRTKLEIKNTAFIYIQRDDRNKVIGFYPVPYESFQAIEYENGLFINFAFSGDATRNLTLPWEDLAVLRKDYNDSDIAGDDNTPILSLLELINTSDQGIRNAIKSTANLRGILRSTKGILDPEDVKENKERFVKDYMGLDNEGGIAALDSSQEFTPIKMDPTIANYPQMKEFRENVYRYYGVSDEIVMSKYTESQMEAFYEARIEPFLVELSLELTKKLSGGNKDIKIIYESNRMQYASNSTKLAMVSMVDRGALTPNEWRMIFNLAPIEGGDKPIRRLDTAEVKEGEENE